MTKMQAKKGFVDEPYIAEPHDDIVFKVRYEEDYLEDGTYTRKPIYEKVNITKKLEQSVQSLNAENIESIIENAKKEIK